jgi:hypothetical protein
MAEPESETEAPKSVPPPEEKRASSVPPAPAPAPAKSSPKISVRPMPAAEGGALGAYESLAKSARLPDLVAITQKVIGEAGVARRSAWSSSGALTSALEETKLAREDADTPFGNAIKVLESGPEGEAERALASALWAHAIAETKRGDDDRLAGDVLWLAAHTPFDATSLLDRALGEDASVMWIAIADRVRRADAGLGAVTSRGECLVGAAALCASSSRAAAKARADLATKVKDPMLVRVLSTADEASVSDVRLEGEAIMPPRGPVATTLLAVTGLLFVIHAVRFIAKYALAFRRPAEVSLTDAGIRVKTRTEMLGRVLREKEHVIVRSGLTRVVREVRYPRVAFYAGLLALAVGSWIGVRAFVDGVRSASPSLLVVGLFIVATGIAADFVLGTLLPGSQKKVRVLFVPRNGRPVCVANVDLARADDALKRALKA